MIGKYFIAFSIVYSLLLIIVYFQKKHIKLAETSIFSKLLIINFCGLVLEMSCYVLSLNTNLGLVSYFVTKIYMLFLLLFIFYITLYIYAICYNNGNNDKITYYSKLKKISIIILVICSFIMFVMPMNTKVGQATGISVNFVYGCATICMCVWIFTMIKNYKKIKKKKFIPLLSFIVLSGITSVIQNYYPQVTLITSVETLIIFLMYFTIENPDVKMIAQLNEAKDTADKANQAKSDFLSSMSHEIRTPLNAIVGFSQSLKEENLSSQAMEEVSDIICASQTLLELVNGILDISKIEANKIEIVNTEYNFKDLFRELVSLSKARLGDKPLEFKYSYDESIPDVLYGDVTRVKQIILNILTNSIKYTKEGYFDFKVNSICNNGICRLIISVEDSGIGIKKENIDKLFDKFERLDEKNTTIEGTGLGLAITKRLVELMHGKIIVQSVYNKGSKFTVILDQKIVKQTSPIKVIMVDDHYNTFPNKKVLVVDDNNLNLKVAARLLKPYELTVETVNSGAECLNNIASNNTYDLILLDDMMPHLSGVDTMHRLKENENFKIPVVALTANAISGMKEKYLADGFDDYLAKPIEKAELNRILNKFLK